MAAESKQQLASKLGRIRLKSACRVRNTRASAGEAQIAYLATFFLLIGLKPKRWPPIDASYIRPFFGKVKTATPLL